MVHNAGQYSQGNYLVKRLSMYISDVSAYTSDFLACLQNRLYKRERREKGFALG